MSRPVILPLRLISQCTRQSPRPLYHQIHTSSTSNPRNPKPEHHHHRRHQAWPSPRTFSTSCQRSAGAQKQVRPQMKTPPQPSISRAQKEQQAQAIAQGAMPDDLGLLPDTFVLPRKLSDRWAWRIRKKWLNTRFWELFSAFGFKFWTVSPRPNLQLSQIPTIAKDLHARVFKAFAAGDLAPAQPFIASGLSSSLRTRLSQRTPNTFQNWHIIRHLSSPRLVSYKAAQFPSSKGETNHERNAQVQAVVRLHTMQSLQNMTRVSQRNRAGTLGVVEQAVGAPQTKESWECVVLQKTLRKGRWGEWAIWGFADEMTLARMEREGRK